MKRITGILSAVLCTMLFAGSAMCADSDSATFTIRAEVGERFSFDTQVLLFTEDPAVDGVEWAGDLDFGELTWQYGRWNAPYAFCIKFYMDSSTHYALTASANHIESATGNISDSIVLVPDWKYADVFIYSNGADGIPGTPDDGFTRQANIGLGHDANTYPIEADAMRSRSFSVGDLVSGAKTDPIYESSTNPTARIIRTYVTVFNVPASYTGSDIDADFPGSPLGQLAQPGVYTGTVTFTMTAD